MKCAQKKKVKESTCHFGAYGGRGNGLKIISIELLRAANIDLRLLVFESRFLISDEFNNSLKRKSFIEFILHAGSKSYTTLDT